MNGRPSLYTPETVKLVLERIATAKVGLQKLCSMYDDMPNSDTIMEWRNKYPEFSVGYLNSRVKQSHILAENTQDIADETMDYVYEDDKTGAKKIDPGIVSMQKMRISNNVWLASVINPKEYAPHKAVEDIITDNAKLKLELEEVRKQLLEAAVKEY